jgi:UDP-N-acetyl-D-glucosamine dehydrogenase
MARVVDAGAPPAVAAHTAADTLELRLRHRTARVGVIGLGYVGLPLIRIAAEAGFTGLGLDIDGRKVEALNAGRSYIRHISDESIAALRAGGRFEASSEFARVADTDVAVICVPTPLSRHREPDLGFVVRTAQSLAPHLHPGQLIVLESTSYPGTTLEVVKPILEGTGLRSGMDFFLAYSPEREDPGNVDHDIKTTPKVVGGDGETALRLACIFYDQFVTRTVPVSSPAVAEAVKITENIFRAVNIALVNELKVVFEAMGIDVWEVIDAAKTKPFGYMPFYPGPGLGGHCIPIDPFYLTWKAREHDITTRFIELAGEVNSAMPRYVVERLALALNARTAKGLNGARILMIGLAYKKNVADMRGSPALTVIELMERRGAMVAYHDPFMPMIPSSREHVHLAGRRSIALDPMSIAAVDAVVIITDHDGIDYEALVAAAPLVIDTRNATRHVGRHRDRIVRA